LKILPEVEKAYKRRLKAGISQTDVRKTSGLNPLTLTRLENGRHKSPKYHTVIRYVEGVEKAIRLKATRLKRMLNEFNSRSSRSR